MKLNMKLLSYSSSMGIMFAISATPVEGAARLRIQHLSLDVSLGPGSLQGASSC